MPQPTQPLTPEELAQAAKNAAHESYPHRLLVDADIAIDEAADGPMDETISSRMSRWSRMTGWRKRVGGAMCKFLNVFQRNHGPRAEVGDIVRAKHELGIEESSLDALESKQPK